VEDYFASEVDANAMKVALKNYPDTQQVGDVKKLCGDCLGEIDLLIGGSPCIDLSIAKQGRKGLDGEHSSLFWEWVRMWKETKPKWWVLENVASMPKKDRDIITKELGVEPVMFNASLVSAQSRKRLFWTNIKFELPEDRGIMLKDILQPDGEVDERMVMKGKAYTLTATHSKVSPLVKVGHIGNSDAQANRVYDPEGKSATLSANGGGLGAKTGLYKVEGVSIRGRKNDAGEWVNQVEVRSDDKASALTTTMSGKLALVKVGHMGTKERQTNRIYDPEGKAPTQLKGSGIGGPLPTLVKVGREIGRRLDADGTRADDDPTLEYQRRIETREDSKCGTLTSVQKDNLVVGERIRKLTPIECERLQSLPDNYTEGIAMTNRYRCLGNAFNVAVVAHILAGIES
jgi:DNA (cytosine-5)-methyltransferase 3A